MGQQKFNGPFTALNLRLLSSLSFYSVLQRWSNHQIGKIDHGDSPPSSTLLRSHSFSFPYSHSPSPPPISTKPKLSDSPPISNLSSPNPNQRHLPPTACYGWLLSSRAEATAQKHGPTSYHSTTTISKTLSSESRSSTTAISNRRSSGTV